MRIPHLINPSTFEVYTTSENCLNLESEQNRHIFADNFKWDEKVVLSLTTLSLQVICDNYQRQPIFDQLAQKDQQHLLELLPTDLPLEMAVLNIHCEYYWERRFKAFFGENFTDRFHRNLTWKEKYLERHLRYLIEKAQPQCQDEDEVEIVAKYCTPYVKHLHVTQMQPWNPPLNCDPEDVPDILPVAHIDFKGIFKNLKLLEEVDITYDVRNLSDTDKPFSMRFFKVSPEDCRRLAEAVMILPEIRILRLTNSLVEDRHVRALMRGLIRNETLEELNFSYCKIGDEGAKCIAKLIMEHPKLTKLILADNMIGAEGAQAIAYALHQERCCPLTHLNLRLNPLRHEGVLAILSHLIRCGKLLEINFAGCGFDDPTVMRLGDFVAIHFVLRTIDISNNYLDEPYAKYLEECMEANTTITDMDLRETDIPPNVEAKIKHLLARNVRLEKGEPIDEDAVNDDEEPKETVFNFASFRQSSKQEDAAEEGGGDNEETFDGEPSTPTPPPPPAETTEDNDMIVASVATIA